MKKLILISIIILIIQLTYSLFLLSKARSFQFFDNLTNRVTTERKIVALTFDDAPSPYVSDVLDVLKEKQVKATFYTIGQKIEKYPNEAKAMVDAKMEVGNHSYSHSRLIFKSQSFIDNEVQKTNKLIRDIGINSEITFRPPNGKKLFGLPYYLSKHNIKTIMWDVEPDTYAVGLKEGTEKTKFLVDYTLSHTKPGSIILLHPFCNSCTSDREAIGKIIDGLQSNGYKFVTISELLSY